MCIKTKSERDSLTLTDKSADEAAYIDDNLEESKRAAIAAIIKVESDEPAENLNMYSAISLGSLAFHAVRNMVARAPWNDPGSYVRPALSRSYYTQFELILQNVDEPFFAKAYARIICQSPEESASFLSRCSTLDSPVALDSIAAVKAADRSLRRWWEHEQERVRYIHANGQDIINAEIWASLPNLERSQYSAKSGSNYRPHSVQRLCWDVLYNMFRAPWFWNRKPPHFKGKWQGNPIAWTPPPLSASYRKPLECLLLMSGPSFWVDSYREKVLRELLDGAKWPSHCHWGLYSSHHGESAPDGDQFQESNPIGEPTYGDWNEKI